MYDIHPQPSKSIFKSIINNYNLGELKTIANLSSGYQNSSYLINNKYVVRIGSGKNFEDEKGYLNRFKREGFLYKNIFPQRTIPTPKLYGVDVSKTIIPQDYIILSYLKGDLISSVYNEHNKITKQQLAFQVGRILKNIHSITEEDLEEVAELFKLKTDWKKAILDDFYKYYKDIQILNLIEGNLLKEIGNTLLDYEKLDIQKDIPIRLLHFDFHGQHIMVDDSRIEAFFDFEWAQLGDPYWDLQLLPINFSVEDFDTEDFLIGYGAHQFTHTELVRLKFYAFFQGIWQIWAIKMGDYNFPEESAQAGIDLIENTIVFYKSYLPH